MMGKASAYVLDSYALLAYFQAEPGGRTIASLLQQAQSTSDVRLYLSTISAGEIYYITCRKLGAERAEELLSDLRKLPVTLCQATEERVFSAARIKAEYPVSYADAFVVGLAKEFDGLVVTGDPEFKAVEPLVDVLWLEVER